MRISLRAFISAVSALSVAAVAALTLGITLTSSLAALRSVGTGQAAALLRAAQLNSEGLFDVPQSAIEALQNTSRGEAWPWPANSVAVQREWQQMHDLLLTDAQGRLAGLATSFIDNTVVSVYTTSDAAGLVPLVGYLITRGSPVNATNPLTGIINQTGLPTSYMLRHRGNRTLMPQADPRFFEIMPRFPYVNYAAIEGYLAGSSAATLGGTLSLVTGFYVTVRLGVVRSYIPFLGTLFRQGETPGVTPIPYGYTYATLLIDDLNVFLRDSRATPGTLAVAVDRQGFLLATSAPDKPFETVTQVAAGTPYGAGCTTTEVSGLANADPNNYMSCRTHASAYGHAGLAAVIARPALAFPAARTVALVHADDGGETFFAGAAPVRTRFGGVTVHLLVLMPEADVIGDVVRSRNVAIGATCGAFVLAACATFAAITLLLAPLGTIADRMERAARFDDDGADEGVSAMAEVAALQEAYYAMNDELNRIRSFVPQSVLVGAVADIEEEDEGELEPTDTTVPDAAGAASVRSIRSSARGSRRSGSRRSGASDPTAAALAGPGATALLLSLKFVTVLVANAYGFSAAIRGCGSGDGAAAGNASGAAAASGSSRGTADALAALVEAVEDAVGTNGGVLGGFHGDHFTATFNAVRPCAAGQRRACAAAWALTQARPGVNGSGDGGLRLKVGVAAGKCLVGNAGSATAKTFSVVGPAFPQAVLLERLSRLYGPECDALVTARVFSDASTAYRFRTVDHVLLPPRHATLVAALLGPIEAAATATGSQNGRGSANTANAPGADADEWLYVLEARAAGDPNAAHNMAFQNLAAGKLDACDAYFATAADSAKAVNAGSESTSHGAKSPPAANHHATLERLIAELRRHTQPPSSDAPMLPTNDSCPVSPPPSLATSGSKAGSVSTYGELHEAHLQ